MKSLKFIEMPNKFFTELKKKMRKPEEEEEEENMSMLTMTGWT